MKDKYEEIYLVTIVIKYTSVKTINNLPLRNQKITIHSEIQKGIPEMLAFDKTLKNCEKKYPDGMQVIAYTVTKLTMDLFNKEEESEGKNGK